MTLNAYLARILWAMLAVAMLWYAYLVATAYASCRADGTSNLVCFFYALILSFFEALIFIIVSAFKFLAAVLP